MDERRSNWKNCKKARENNSVLAEYALEDGVDVLEVIAEVELLGYLGVAEILLHLSVLFQQRLEVAFAAPHRHGVALHEFVGVLAAGAFLRQRHQKPLRMNQPAEAVEIFLHVLGGHQQLLDQARQTLGRKIHS